MKTSPDGAVKGATALYVQAILLFLPGTDRAAASYFYDHQEEVNAITGVVLQVVMPGLPRSAEDVVTAIDSKRYPGLKTADLPCLWVEGGGGAHLVARLPTDVPGAKKVLYELVDAFRHAQTFAQAEQRFTASQSPPPKPSSGHIVMSLHGFNTRGAWQKQIQTCFNESELGLAHEPSDYGHVNVRCLLSFAERTAEVNKFLQEYQKLVLRSKLLDSPPSVIAHSFGSYIVARAMKENPHVRFRRIVFCGSIVRRDYDWSARIESGQVERVLNEYSRRDIWPRVAEWVMSDVGSAGTKGFENTAGGAVVQREYRFWTHSSYFFGLHQRNSWLPFLASQRDPEVVVPTNEESLNLRFSAFVAAMAVLAGAAGWAVWRYIFMGG